MTLPRPCHAPSPVCAPSLHVTHLACTDFRNYTSALVQPQQRAIVLYGANGAGKTNVLEALSLLIPGRGLRRAPPEDWARSAGAGTWSVHAQLQGCERETTAIGTGVQDSADPSTRRFRLNGKDVARLGDVDELIALLWLTPDQDGLLRGPAGDRRRFIDRFATALDPTHGTRVNALDKLLRSRNRALEDGGGAGLLEALEHELAAQAVAVAAGRAHQVEMLNSVIERFQAADSPFPQAQLQLEGILEERLGSKTSATVEDEYRAVLRASRAQDRQAGRTGIGAHASDLLITHKPKNRPARQCSTGEQKALLLGLVLAQARLVGAQRGRVPILLLDEVAAHLDSLRRAALFDELEEIGTQSWLTGTDSALFSALEGRAAFFEVQGGEVKRAG